MTNPQDTTPRLTSKQAEIILEALRAKGASNACSRCGNAQHSLEKALSRVDLHRVTNDTYLGGPHIPTAIVICLNCGLVNQHALGALGLLEHPAFDLRRGADS